MIENDALVDLERQVGSWSEENFGEQPARYPLLGVGEEYGEGLTSVLKRLQGIDDSEKYADREGVGPDAEKDAIGDMVIYLADYVHRRDGLTFERVSETKYATSYDRIDEIALDIADSYGRLCRAERYESEPTIHLAMGSLLTDLSEFCAYRGYDMAQCIEDAWSEVSGREWDADITTDDSTDEG